MSTNPFLRRRITHAIGKPGRSSEKRLAREMKVKPRPASGALQGMKGDIDAGAFLVEAKSTTRDSMSLKLEWLAKIKREARQDGKKPALAISFVHESGQPQKDGEWVMVPKSVWDEL